MKDQPDLVGLLYRADWTRLSLTAEVSVTRDRDLWRSRFDEGPPRRARGGEQFGPWSALWFGPPRFGPPLGVTDEDPDAPWGPQPDGREWELATEVLGTESKRSTLVLAPGGRYREQGDGYLCGCDGERSWHAVPDDGSWSAEATGGPEPPPAAWLLRPSWLLTGFTLEPGGLATVSGRDALRVVATPRPGLELQRVVTCRPLDRVEVAVDAELGILLRCEEILDGRPLRVTELADLLIDPASVADDALFRPPGGWDGVKESAPPEEFGPGPQNGPGWEVTKVVAGLAAGGLGALIKSSRFRPFERATQEEAEAEMPSADGPLLGDGPLPGDEVLRLLHSGPDRWSAGITATLHEWCDVAAMLARIPDGARRVGFGGLGHLIDAAAERIATVPSSYRVRLGGPGRYRIEPVQASGPFSETIICDGERRWRIGEHEAVTGPATPLPGAIGILFDASWLLEHQLTSGGEITAGGRRGYRLGVTRGGPRGGWLFPGDAVVDAELGVLLRCISWSGIQPVLRYELRDIVPGPAEPGDFRPDIPAGMRVTEESDDEPPPNPVGAWARQAGSAVKSFLGARVSGG